MNQKLTIDQQAIVDRMLKSKGFRLSLVKKSPLWFFYFYLSEYIESPVADFHKEMFSLIENESIKFIVITAFRGSGKSTIMTTAYPLWAVLGEQKKKFILILSQTQHKAQQHLLNIKYQLESNTILRQDLGPFQEERNQWGAQSLFIKKFNAKISTGSTEQSIRGLRHNQYRPDLIILDDIEDIQSVKTKEGRDKVFKWLTGEVIPAGNTATRLVLVGNLLHEDAVLPRIQEMMDVNSNIGVYKEYPLLDDNDNPLWQGKYPNTEIIREERAKVMDETTYQREYLLRIIPDAERVVWPDWIHYYDELPPTTMTYRFSAVGIDPAISQKQTGDYTAMVAAHIYGYSKEAKIYILPHPVNERLTFPQTIERAELLSDNVGYGMRAELCVEQVAYQESLIHQLLSHGYPTKGVTVGGNDKRARLASVSHLIQSGTIVFPKKGAEDLITQITGFGSEKHDDLVDAFTTVIRKVHGDVTRTSPDIMLIKY